MGCTAITNLLTLFVVSAYGKGVGVESSNGFMRCSFDHDCPDRMFCYEESGHCSQCYDCGAYKRKASWRTCAKSPTDCGQCVAGFEEEIFHDGAVREMCVPTSATTNSLSHPNGFHHESMERYIWGLGATILVLVVAFSIFCKRSWKRVGLTAHQGMPREEPPPYRSIELTTLNSNNSSVEMLAEDDHVLRVGQTKESPVQAVPFRQPDYITPQEYPDFDNQDSLTDELELELEPYVNGNEHNAPIVDLLDDNTMPSDWTPQQNEEQMEVEEAESLDDADACEHSSNRHKSDAGANDENYSGLLNINLLINNNITINKH